MGTLFILSKDKVYKDIEAEILPKIKDILRTEPSLRFIEKKFHLQFKIVFMQILGDDTLIFRK